jgi:hypothetical protein
MVRSAPDARPGFHFTSQLYFDDELTDRVHAEAPYASKGPRNVRNERDGIFRRGGRELMLDVRREKTLYRGEFALALDLPETSDADRARRRSRQSAGARTRRR